LRIPPDPETINPTHRCKETDMTRFNPSQAAEGNAALAVLEEDDTLLMLIAAVVHRSRQLLEEAGVAAGAVSSAPGASLPAVIEQMTLDAMIGDTTKIEVEYTPSGDFNFGATVTVTLEDDE
jgi:hypothetical protein